MVQVSGVCSYSNRDCAPCDGLEVISSLDLASPEGLAFAKGFLYVARWVLLLTDQIRAKHPLP